MVTLTVGKINRNAPWVRINGQSLGLLPQKNCSCLCPELPSHP